MLCLRSAHSQLDQLMSDYAEVTFFYNGGALVMAGVTRGGSRTHDLRLCGRLFKSAQAHLLTIQGRDIYPGELPQAKVRVGVADGIPVIAVKIMESVPRDR